MAGNKRKSKASKQPQRSSLPVIPQPSAANTSSSSSSGVTTRQQAHKIATGGVGAERVDTTVQLRAGQKRRQEESGQSSVQIKRHKVKEDMKTSDNEGKPSSSPTSNAEGTVASPSTNKSSSASKKSKNARMKTVGRRSSIPVSGGASNSAGGGSSSSTQPSSTASSLKPAGTSAISKRTTPSPFDNDFNVDDIRTMLIGRGVPSDLLNHPGMQNALIHEYMGNNAASNVNKMISQLVENVYDPENTFVLLSEMNQYLLVAGEEGIMHIRYREMVQAFKPILISDLHSEESKTMCLNVLSHLMDSWPRAADTVITLLPEIVQLVQNCYMGEIFERVIHCMEHLSRRQGYTILNEDCINKLLPIFEFLTSSQLRTALQLVSNCVSAIPSTVEFERLFHKQQDCIKFLVTRGLKMSDRECVEITSDVLQHIVAALSPTHPHLLAQIVTEEFLVNLQALLLATPMQLRSFAVVLRILTDLCQHSPAFAFDVMKTDMAATLVHAMRGSNDSYHVSNMDLSHALSTLNHDDVYETVALIAELMPRLPSDCHGRPLYLYGSPQGLPPLSTKCHLPSNASPPSSRWYYRLNPAICYTPLPATISQMLDVKQQHQNRNTTHHHKVSSSSSSTLSVTSQDRTVVIQEEQAFAAVTTGGSRRGSKEKLSAPELALCTHVQSIIGFPMTANLSKKKLVGPKASVCLQRLPPLESDDQQQTFCERVSLLRILETDTLEGASSSSSSAASSESVSGVVRRTLFTLYPLVVDICRDVNSTDIKCKAIEALLRLLCYVPAPILKTLQYQRSLSSLVMDLFSSHDSHVIIGAIHFSQLLLDKLPQHMAQIYRKEGLLHKITTLLTRTEKNLATKLEKQQALEPACVQTQSQERNRCSSRFLGAPSPYSSARFTRRGRGTASSSLAQQQPGTSGTGSSGGATSSSVPSRASTAGPSTMSIKSHRYLPSNMSRVNRSLQQQSHSSAGPSSSGAAGGGGGSVNSAQFQSVFKFPSANSMAIAPSPAQEALNTEIQELKWMTESLQTLIVQVEQYAATPDHIHETTVTRLRELSDRLKASVEDVFNPQNCAETRCLLVELAENLTVGGQSHTAAQDDAFISPYEFIQCGLVDSLLYYLTAPIGDKYKRIMLFCEVFLQKTKQDLGICAASCTSVNSSGGTRPPLAYLVTHLLAALHHQEQFPVLPAPLPRRTQIRMAAQPLPTSTEASTDTSRTGGNAARLQQNSLRRIHSYHGDPYVPRLQCTVKAKANDISPVSGGDKTSAQKRSSEGSATTSTMETTRTTASLTSPRSIVLSLYPLSTTKELAHILARLHQRHNLHSLQVGSIRVPSAARLGLDMSTSSGEFDYDDEEDDDEDDDEDEDDAGGLSVLAHSMDDDEDEERMVDDEDDDEVEDSDTSSHDANLLSNFVTFKSGKSRHRDATSPGSTVVEMSDTAAPRSSLADPIRPISGNASNVVMERLLMEPNDTAVLVPSSSGVARLSGTSGSSSVAVTRAGTSHQQSSSRQNHMLDLLEYLEDWTSIGRSAVGSTGRNSAGPSSSHTVSPATSPVTIRLFINGHELPSHMTLYEAVIRFGGATCLNDANHSSTTDVWTNSHAIEFEVVTPSASSSKQPVGEDRLSSGAKNEKTSPFSPPPPERLHLMPLSPDIEEGRSSLTPTLSKSVPAISQVRHGRKRKSTSERASTSGGSASRSPYEPVVLSMLSSTLPAFEREGESGNGDVGNTLALLKCLHALNRYWYTIYNVPDTRLVIPEREFVSVKLCGKVNRQLQSYFNVLTNTLPDWLTQLMQQCPFLFTFEAKLNFFYLHNCDRDRAQTQLSTMGVHDETHGANFGQPSSNLHRGGPHRSDLHRSHTASSTLTSLGGSASFAGMSHIGGGSAGGPGNGPSAATLRRTDSSRSHLNSTAANPVLNKTRVTINRDESLLQQAEQGAFASLISSASDVLEIQFAGEVGFGLGPTQEFYTLLCRELMREDLKLWHHNGVVSDILSGDEGAATTQYVIPHPPGLFPQPVAKTEDITELLERFHFIGSLLGRALLDQRLLDLPLSPLVFRCLMNRYEEVTGADLCLVDPSITRHMRELALTAQKVKQIRWEHGSGKVAERAIENLAVEELYLNFTLPGYDIELMENGRHVDVTADNLEEYINLVITTYLRDGVVRQLQALREGFDYVISMSRLAVFQPEELEAYLCGGELGTATTSSSSSSSTMSEIRSVENEYWSVRSLMQACHLDHGYMADSPAVRYLFEIMSRFTREERRLFMQFVTGSPRLPWGGFQALRPPLTIVMKRESHCPTDDQLPSVMTCQSYLKLPNYSSMEKMREKLLLAIREGQQAFLLS